jgi:hypothetical protein
LWPVFGGGHKPGTAKNRLFGIQTPQHFAGGLNSAREVDFPGPGSAPCGALPDHSLFVSYFLDAEPNKGQNYILYLCWTRQQGL